MDPAHYAESRAATVCEKAALNQNGFWKQNTKIILTYTNSQLHRSTWPEVYIHRAVLMGRAADAQLTHFVAAPTLDGASGHDRARVGIPQDDADGKDAWQQQRRKGRLMLLNLECTYYRTMFKIYFSCCSYSFLHY
jgi:hypothetical protein